MKIEEGSRENSFIWQSQEGFLEAAASERRPEDRWGLSQAREGGKGPPGRGNRIGQAQRSGTWLVRNCEPPGMTKAGRSGVRGGRCGRQEIGGPGLAKLSLCLHQVTEAAQDGEQGSDRSHGHPTNSLESSLGGPKTLGKARVRGLLEPGAGRRWKQCCL